MQAGSGATPPGIRRALLIYTALRLVVFVGTAGVLIVFGLNGFPLLLIALLISSIASLFVLRPQRDALTAAQQARNEYRRAEKERDRSRLEGS
ncbi:MAG: hypothetical protein JWN35_1563 [Frankiales bacterium]|nr:hypothetical protein [Frankiales bacterium]